MKNWKARISVLIINFLCLVHLSAQTIEKRCVTHEVDLQKRTKNSTYAKNIINFESRVNQYVAANKNAKKSNINELIRIPVVVHVIHNSTSGTIGGAKNSNISDAQINSQIDVLNEDYRRKAGTLGFNSNPIGADMNIEFYLADTDPAGNDTNGITRTFSTKASFDPFNDTDQKAISDLVYWSSESYLNIWVVALSNNYLGYSQFPSAPNFDGLDSESDSKLDGLYIDYRYFGRNTGAITSKYYKFGRTTTHEIGHWLGLIHTWGDEDCGDDYCEDTPQANGPNLTIYCKDVFSNCTGTKSTRNMIENYLDYTIDSCMNTFTADQLARVRAVFELSPSRKKLVLNSVRLPESENLILEINPNPVFENIEGKVFLKGKSTVDIAIFDSYGREIDRRVFENKRSFNFTMPIIGFQKGIYFVNVAAQGKRVSKRILISNK